MSKKHNIIIISSVDWSTHWQMHHQLSMSFIKSGSSVLFIENTGIRGMRFKDTGRIFDRIITRFKSMYGFSEIEKKLFVFSPLFIPVPYSRVVTYINQLFIFRAIGKWIDVTGFSNPIVITFLPTPLAQGLIHKINPRLAIYYCANHMVGMLNNTDIITKWENNLFKTSDAVFTISDDIKKRASKFSGSVYSFPAGVDIKNFNPSLVDSVPNNITCIASPIIGYVGAISDVFDQELVVKLSEYFSHATILLVGPVHTDISKLEACDNVILLGEFRHNLIPSYINNFDVALIPYIVNEFTDSVYSCKLNEYLAMGVPVVSTNMKEVRIFLEQYQESLEIGKNLNDFVKKVESILSNPLSKSHDACNKRIAIAKNNTWDSRFFAITEVINRINKKNKNINKVSLIARYNKIRSALFKRLLVVFGLYFLIFFSPLIGFLGDFLVMRDAPQKTDAIVVFSGDGEASYTNESYQRRALDAIQLYKDGYASSIFLSSGREQTLPEVEIIKLFLIKNDVPLSNIHILNRYPRSTYQNVNMVRKMLEDSGVESINFITSPYHSYRATLLWKKHAPNILIHSVPVRDTPSSSMQWGSNTDTIKIVLYEYAAIAYNWAKGLL